MSKTAGIDPWLHEHLVCPRDHEPLRAAPDALRCSHGHVYPVIDGVPILLVDDARQNFGAAGGSIARAMRGEMDSRAPELYLESVGISEDEKRGVLELAERRPVVDPVVAYLVAATNGLMYRSLIGRLESYPIPEITLPAREGQPLLDIGCSWGRWTLAAAQRGYRAIGIDPSLGAVMAARRVSRQLNLRAMFVVGDARFLPFRAASFRVAYSYSVIQHFSRSDAAMAVDEIARVLEPGGHAKVQMPTRFGARCLYHQIRRGFADGAGFDVRYWTIPALRRLFGERIGPVRFEIDGFFGIGLQRSDERLMPATLRLVLKSSEALKAAAPVVPALRWVADSVFVDAEKREGVLAS